MYLGMKKICQIRKNGDTILNYSITGKLVKIVIIKKCLFPIWYRQRI